MFAFVSSLESVFDRKLNSQFLTSNVKDNKRRKRMGSQPEVKKNSTLAKIVFTFLKLK